MSARHASGLRCRSSDPIGFVLSLLWAIGTASGFVCLGMLADNHLNEPLANGPALTTPDAAPEAA
ncbi:hypothetical protein [Streptomyces sp. NPDC058307]|uniref:hypothetical protein n=1 Tax=Streptomyces sp. NPDC058307 TaxID=3346439 RepID=UPI0036E86459